MELPLRSFKLELWFRLDIERSSSLSSRGGCSRILEGEEEESKDDGGSRDGGGLMFFLACWSKADFCSSSSPQSLKSWSLRF